LSTEVPVGSANGLDRESVISCDNITTVPVAQLLRQVGQLLPDQEVALAEAIVAAFDLD
jgi:mRNA interferase MazF